MKIHLLSVAVLSLAVTMSSCGSWNNMAKGTAIGVGGGAAVGAGVGALAGNTALGSVIGAAVGGTAGALIGKKMDKQKKELEATLPEETQVETINNGEALRVTFDSGILFATNSSTLSEASRSALRKLAESLNQNLNSSVQCSTFNCAVVCNRLMNTFSFIFHTLAADTLVNHQIIIYAFGSLLG